MLKPILSVTVALLFAGCAAPTSKSDIVARAAALRAEAKAVEETVLREECERARKERNEQLVSLVESSEKSYIETKDKAGKVTGKEAPTAINITGGIPAIPQYCRFEGETTAEVNSRINALMFGSPK